MEAAPSGATWKARHAVRDDLTGMLSPAQGCTELQERPTNFKTHFLCGIVTQGAETRLRSEVAVASLPEGHWWWLLGPERVPLRGYVGGDTSACFLTPLV